MKAFLDADVLFAALYSDKGSSRAVLNLPDIELITSHACVEEAERSLFLKYELRLLVQDTFPTVEINSFGKNFAEYSHLVLDEYDRHVVAAAANTKANFLLTFNTKHYLKNKIEDELGIVVMQPKHLLFYLRNVQTKMSR